MYQLVPHCPRLLLYPRHTKYEGVDLYSFRLFHSYICMSDCVCMCMCKILFRKHFSGTTYGFEIRYKCWVLYERKLASSCLSFPLLVNFSFSPIKFYVTDFSAPMRARVFTYCKHKNGQVYCGKENQNAKICFCLFSISISPFVPSLAPM